MGFKLSFDDKPMELVEHLGELRTRIIRSMLWLIVGASVAYQFFPMLYGSLYRPLERELKKQSREKTHSAQARLHIERLERFTKQRVSTDDLNKLVDAYNDLLDHPPATPYISTTFRNFYDPFMVRLKVSMVGGFILVLPMVLWQLFAFILPALTVEERRPLKMLMPISTVLTVAGLAVGYVTMFTAMHWFLSYLADFPEGASLMQDPETYVLFFVKMMAAFAVAFQLPVVIMGLAFVGMITSAGLIKHWRWGVVVAVLGGVFTPANDLISMALMTFPLLLLYFLSIFLVKGVERSKRKKTEKFEHPET